MTHKKETLHGIQILRGIAALLVVTHHSFLLGHETTDDSFFQVGSVGVDIFFAISGVVMFMTARGQTPGQFMLRRLIRIVPLFWFFMILKIILMAAVTIKGRNDGIDLAYIVKSFLFIPVRDINGNIFPLIGVAWTLDFEMYFYVICALALMFSPRRFLTVLLTIIPLGIIVGLPFMLHQSDAPAESFILSPIALEFIGGTLAAYFWTKGRVLPLIGNVALLIVSVLWLALAPLQEIYGLTRVIWWGVPGAAITWAVLGLETQLPFVRMRFPLLVGDASYAIYLAHTAAIPLMNIVLTRLGVHGAVEVPILIIGSLAVGIGVHLIIENRLTRFARMLAAPRSPVIGVTL